MTITLCLTTTRRLPNRFPTIPNNVARYLNGRYKYFVHPSNMSSKVITTQIRRRLRYRTIIMNYHTLSLLIVNHLLRRRFAYPTIRHPRRRQYNQPTTLRLRNALITRVHDAATNYYHRRIRLLAPRARYANACLQPTLSNNHVIMAVHCFHIKRIIIINRGCLRNYLLFLARRFKYILILRLTQGRTLMTLRLGFHMLRTRTAHAL